MKTNSIQVWAIKAMLLVTGSFLLQACPSESYDSTSSTPSPQSPIPETVEEEPPNHGVSAPPKCQELNPGSISLSDPDHQGKTGGFYCFSVKDENNLQGVLTLRHTSGNGDWDITVGRNLDPTSNQLTNPVSHQPSRGTINELVMLPGNNGNPYYVHVTPTSTNLSSKACLVFHQFDNGQIFAESLITTLIERAIEGTIVGDQPTAEAEANASRIVSVGSSVLRQRNVGQSSYDLLLNEVSLQLQNAFGTDSWFYDFGIDFFGGYLEESLKHLFTSDANCAG